MISTKDNMEQFTEFSANSLESMRSLGELNLSTWEKLMEKQMAAFSLCLDTGIQQLNLATETPDSHAAIKGQTELAKQLGEALTEKAKEAQKLSTEVGNDYRQWFENSMNNFNSKAED